MATELPEDFDRDDIVEYVTNLVHEQTNLLQDQIDVLQKLVDANEGQADADREEVKRLADIVDAD